MAGRRRITIDVVTDDKQARAGLKRVAGEAQKTGSDFSKLGKQIAGAFALRKVVSSIGDATRRAEAMESQYAVTTQVIKSTGEAANVTADHVKGLAKEQAHLTGIDKELILQGQNVLLTFKNIANQAGEGNDIFDQTAGIMLDMSTVMGTDAKSAALQLGKALNDPVKGISALTRVGVTFTEEQQNQIKALSESGNALEAQKIILQELQSEFGGTAEAAADTSKQIAVSWQEAQEQIGNSFLAVGKAVAPVAIDMAKGLGVWAIALQEATGQITPLEQAIAQFETATGSAAEGAAALLTIWKEYGIPLEELIGKVPLAAEEVDQLRGSSDSLLESLGFTKDEIAELKDLLEKEVVTAAQTAREKGIHPLRFELELTEDAADGAGDALKALTDPLFGVLRATDKVKAAQDKYNDAVAKYGSKSDQAEDAALDLAEALIGLEIASGTYAEDGGQQAVDALVDMLEQAGIADETIRGIIAAIEDLNNTPVSNKFITNPKTGQVEGAIIGGVEARASGGPVDAGGAYVVGEDGPELLKMGSQGGTIIPNDKLGGSGSSTVINLNALSLSDRQLKEIQEMARRS